MVAYYAHIPVDRGYPLVRAGLEQFAGDELLESQDHAVFALDANCCAAIFYCLHCVFDLIM